MPTPPFNDDTLLARWLGGTLDAAEEAALRKRPDFADFERLVNATKGMEAPAFDVAENYKKLQAARAKRATSPTKRHPLRAVLRPALVAAAAIALLLSIWYFLPASEQQFVAERGQRIEAASLADGSVVSLNASSTLTFKRMTNERIARVSGEVFFDVAEATDTFRVITALGQVTVVGTAFNVYSRQDSLAVSCMEGKVRVAFAGLSTTTLLSPGESVYRISGSASRSDTTNVTTSLDWREGRSVFVNRPLAEILDGLERQFDLEIERPTGLDLNKRYDITFPNDNLTQALENTLTPVKNYTYIRSGKRVQLLVQ